MSMTKLLQMILFQYLVKTAIAVIDTPLSYYVVKSLNDIVACCDPLSIRIEASWNARWFGYGSCS